MLGFYHSRIAVHYAWKTPHCSPRALSCLATWYGFQPAWQSLCTTFLRLELTAIPPCGGTRGFWVFFIHRRIIWFYFNITLLRNKLKYLNNTLNYLKIFNQKLNNFSLHSATYHRCHSVLLHEDTKLWGGMPDVIGVGGGAATGSNFPYNILST